MISKLGILLLIIGLGCLISFKLIGSSIDAEGILHEPFPLLALGWIAIIVGGFTTMVSLIFRLKAYLTGR
jgi:hypothetical protein